MINSVELTTMYLNTVPRFLIVAWMRVVRGFVGSLKWESSLVQQGYDVILYSSNVDLQFMTKVSPRNISTTVDKQFWVNL